MPQLEFAGEFIVKPGWTLGPRHIPEYELVYFPSGSKTTYEVDGRIYSLDIPCFIFTRPFEKHKYVFDNKNPTRHLFIHFNCDRSKADAWLSEFISSQISFIEYENNGLLPRLLKHILHLADVKAYNWHERGNVLLQTILIEICGMQNIIHNDPIPPSMPSQIIKALNYIDINLANPLNVSEVAAVSGWTHEHFTRVFTEHVGHSPQNAILIKRIERGCQLLLFEEWTIKQIAFEIGFKDEHYFSRSFKYVKGMTASQYRKKYSDSRLHHLSPAEEFTSPYPLNKYIFF
jgi:AraC-like DNA-binding protein